MSEQYYRKLLRKSKLSKKDYISILLTFIRRSAREWSFFKTSFIFNIVGIVTGVLSYYFIKLMLNPSEIVSGLIPYGGDFMAFLVVGIAFQQYIDIALHGYYEGLANAYWSSTLEQYLTSPLNPLVFCVASVIWSFIIRSLNFMLYLIFGVVLFGVKILFTNVLPVILIFCVSTIAVSGLGLLSASTFTLINAKGWEDPIRWAITTLEGLVVGTYYTPKVLPTFLQVLGLTVDTPAIFITFQQHRVQEQLIKTMQEKGVVIWIPREELSVSRLSYEIHRVLSDSNILSRMSEAKKDILKEFSAKKVVDAILQLL